jgi:hypothetical protein
MIKRQQETTVIVFELCPGNKSFKKAVVIFHSVQKCLYGTLYPVPQLNLPHTWDTQHPEIYVDIFNRKMTIFSLTE